MDTGRRLCAVLLGQAFLQPPPLDGREGSLREAPFPRELTVSFSAEAPFAGLYLRVQGGEGGGEGASRLRLSYIVVMLVLIITYILLKHSF